MSLIVTLGCAPRGPKSDTHSDRHNAETIRPGAKVLHIEWSDLMPEGENLELDRQYTEFYSNLERRLATMPAQSLAEVGRAGGYAAIREGSMLDAMPQLGTFNVVEDLIGEIVRIPGFIVPLEFDVGRGHSGFLVVPYYGACIHTPPPPPNNILYVKASPSIAIGNLSIPYWVEGVLAAEKYENALGDAAYSLTLKGLEPYRG